MASMSPNRRRPSAEAAGVGRLADLGDDPHNPCRELHRVCRRPIDDHHDLVRAASASQSVEQQAREPAEAAAVGEAASIKSDGRLPGADKSLLSSKIGYPVMPATSPPLRKGKKTQPMRHDCVACIRPGLWPAWFDADSRYFAGLAWLRDGTTPKCGRGVRPYRLAAGPGTSLKSASFECLRSGRRTWAMESPTIVMAGSSAMPSPIACACRR